MRCAQGCKGRRSELARYEHITRFIPELEAITSEAEGRKLEGEFVEAMYDPLVLDRNYVNTLEVHGLTGGCAWHANAESLPLEAAVAVLTLIHRAERGMYDPTGKTPLLQSFEDGYGLRILRRIAELDGTWVRPNVITFYHEYEKDGYLSNWYESAPFTYGGRTFATSEHWMMWQKACVFGSWDIAEQILSLPTFEQGKVKWLGRNKVTGFDPGVWDAVDRQLMRVGLRQKFFRTRGFSTTCWALARLCSARRLDTRTLSGVWVSSKATLSSPIPPTGTATAC